MRISFLGTGTSQGVPVIACKCATCASPNSLDKRLRTSALVEVDGLNILIDAGPDFRQQMLRSRIERLDAILFTHAHKDHTAGLDDIRAFNYVQQQPMPIYAEQNVFESLQHEYQYIFEVDKYPGVPEITVNPITTAPFSIQNTLITPVRALHAKLPILGFRIKSLAYITDAKFIADEECLKLECLDLLVINALRHEEHHSHFSLSDALDFIAKIQPKRAFITHISHQMGLHEEVSKSLPANVALAYDNLSITL